MSFSGSPPNRVSKLIATNFPAIAGLESFSAISDSVGLLKDCAASMHGVGATCLSGKTASLDGLRDCEAFGKLQGLLMCCGIAG